MPPKKARALILMSGGIDSAACAYQLIERGLNVSAFFVDYGQAALRAEKRAAIKMARYLDIPLELCSIKSNAKFSAGELAGRNAFLIFSALFLGRHSQGLIAMGVHGGSPYFDCSIGFVDSISRLISEHTNGRSAFIAPFLSWTKQEVFEYFSRANLPLEATYSCESNARLPCGKCLSCRDRKALGC